MGDLKLIDGQFIRDGKIVSPEIGNAEQIALLKKYERENKYAGHIEAEFSAEDLGYTPTATFRCACGEYQRATRPIEYVNNACDFDAYNLGEEWDGDIVKCDKCGRKYIVNGNILELRK